MAGAGYESLVEYFGIQRDGHCGYCNSEANNRTTYGMWAHKITTQIYQDLLDRGWRRSGKYCYKNINDKICCPQYSIRCDAPNFVLTRSQKRTIARMKRFLLTGELKSVNSNLAKSSAGCVQPKKSDVANPVQCKKEIRSDENDADRRTRKAKYRRRQRKLEKLRASGVQIDVLPPKATPLMKSLEQQLAFPSGECAHRLELRLVRSMPVGIDFAESVDDSVAVYKRYQETVHNDDNATDSGFQRFLIDSPLTPSRIPNVSEVDHPGYGSFHQQYWLDGDKLIAVGVLDILPNSVSSKYFYYDVNYRGLGLGIYSALQEIALVRRLQRITPNLRYYYMGFYIHSCPKMRYKSRYRPAELLCQETYTWQPIDKCLPKLDQQPYCRFDETDSSDVDRDFDIDHMIILYQRRLMPYVDYRSLQTEENDGEEVVEYARLAGKKAATKMLLYRS